MHWFTQKLDHFDRQERSTWQQRSFQNDTFFNGTGPVFLCVGGEGPALDESVLVASVHCNDMVELAPKVGALMFAVEHRWVQTRHKQDVLLKHTLWCPLVPRPFHPLPRPHLHGPRPTLPNKNSYYGQSLPTGRDMRTENLRWLSSQQALADLAEFRAQAAANYSLTPANKWVAFGGSYPGMLAGFFRLKYPHLVHAAVSSSAPWQAVTDMQAYQDLVGDSLAITSVGGSDACKATVVDGHAAIAELITTSAGRDELATLFNFCDPATALSSQVLF